MKVFSRLDVKNDFSIIFSVGFGEHLYEILSKHLNFTLTLNYVN